MDQSQVDLTNGTQALTEAVQASAIQGGATTNASAAAKAPGLATGTDALHGYNYERFTGPAVPVITNNLVVQAKQQMLKDVLKDAAYASTDNLASANLGYRARQRDYYRKQAIAAAERQRKADEENARYQQAQLAAVAAQNAANTAIATAKTPAAAVVSKTAPVVNSYNTTSPQQTWNPQAITVNPQPQTVNPQAQAGVTLQGGGTKPLTLTMRK